MSEEKRVPLLYTKKENCCGCTACYSICPKNAITMVEDECGFGYPKIDEDICIRCHLCICACPMHLHQCNL